MLNRYIIERKIPGVGSSSDADFGKMASKSNEVLTSLGPKIQWVQSFITKDKVYCEYLAENEDIVKEHAKLAGFPADSVLKVNHVCDPTEAESDFDAIRKPETSGKQSNLHA